MKAYILSSLLLLAFNGMSQNLVPNPSFEDNGNCFNNFPHMDCAPFWEDHLTVGMNTPDICYNGAVFFPPSSIPAFDGNHYLGFDCQAWGFSEFGQVKMSTPMIAGVTYCVSFYASSCDQNVVIPPSVGIRFSENEETENPFDLGLQADVQGAVPFDPAIWTQITGTYTANGGEEFLQVGGFQNNLQGNFTYMYVDLIEVSSLAPINLPETSELCLGDVQILSGSDIATAYLWSTGETSQTIEIAEAGAYWLEEIRGACTLSSTIVITEVDCGQSTPTTVDNGQNEPSEELVTQGMSVLFVPNAFTPDGDSHNNDFKAIGESIEQFQMTIYNKWGEIIFTANDINQAWDGNNAVGPAQSDVYAYHILYEAELGPKEQFGHVVLLR
ncbi:MAG: gliding motility-associated-like protein [Arenicella sp.]|jgi:gliding motility-associated-like protein